MIILGLTLSGDGTSHKKINYESKHIAVKVPSYSGTGPTGTVAEADSDFNTLHASPPKHKLGFMGAESTVNHSSETQLESWKNTIARISDTFNRSPLSGNSRLTARDFARKFRGMNSDHANDQKKTTRLFTDWKIDEAMAEIGEEAFMDLPPMAQLLSICNALQEEITRLGGQDKWNVLSCDNKQAITNTVQELLYKKMGRERFPRLPEEEQRKWVLVIWAGCGMHKDMNAMKYGVAAMGLAWNTLETTRPVDLHNKDNDATLNLEGVTADTHSDELTAAARRVLSQAGRGAGKWLELLAMFLKNKNDKKGQGDNWNFFSEKETGKRHDFAAVNNTRYHSKGDASGQYWDNPCIYPKFMVLVRDSKDKMGFNHLELNVWKGLHDIPTLTEVAALLLYSEALTFQYVPHVRKAQAIGRDSDAEKSGESNALDLGPYYDKVKKHVDILIKFPELIINDNPDYTVATLDGHNWKYPDAIKNIMAARSTMPHLTQIFKAMLEGALDGWINFTAEYAAGGIIDGSTSEERDEAYLPPTNDANEGALGSMRRCKRERPLLSQHLWNASKMYHKNDTEAYMDTKLSDEATHAFIRQEAREQDSMGLESKRREMHTTYNEETAKSARIHHDEMVAKRAAQDALLDAIPLETNWAVLKQKPNKILKEQLRKYRKLDPLIPMAKDTKVRDTMLKALKPALIRHQERLLALTATPGEMEDLGGDRATAAQNIEMIVHDDDGYNSDDDA